MRPLSSIAVVINASKPEALPLAEQLRITAESLGCTVRLTKEYPVPRGFLENADLCCAIGGDGTILSIVEEAILWETPILGINVGKLGFLASFSPEGSVDGLRKMISGDYHLSGRSLLRCETADGQIAHALNDSVIRTCDARRLVNLRVSCNGKLVTTYACDGLIFTTPTGSTAYNLSAGGPIVATGADVFTMTPICPHTLSNRSLVLPPDADLLVECVDNPVLPQVNIDGKQPFNGIGQAHVRLRKSPKTLKMMLPAPYPFFEILRTKLKWGNNT